MAWDNLGTIVAIVMALIAVAGHVFSAIWFLARWKSHTESLDKDFKGLRVELKEGLGKLGDRLEVLATRSEQIAVLQSQIDSLRRELDDLKGR